MRKTSNFIISISDLGMVRTQATLVKWKTLSKLPPQTFNEVGVVVTGTLPPEEYVSTRFWGGLGITPKQLGWYRGKKPFVPW